MSIRSHSQAQKISETSQTSPARGLFQHPKSQPEVVNEQERPKIPIIQDGKFNGDFSQVPVHNTPRIQPKLKLGQPGDRFEQEADRVARQVVRGSHPMAAINRSPSPGGHNYLQERLQRLELGQEIEQLNPAAIAPYSIQALCSDCDEKVQRQEMMEEDETEEILQAKTADGEIGTVDPNIEDKITTSRGKGQPLSESTRDFMEPRFGADFSGVKVHTDGQADGLNRSLHARAFTTGQDIFFRQGEYNPGSQQGKELLAHELTHVVQQTNTIQSKANTERLNETTIIQRAKHPISVSGGNFGLLAGFDDSYISFSTEVKAFPETGSNFSIPETTNTIKGEDLYKGGAEKGNLVVETSYTAVRDDSFLTGGDKEKEGTFESYFDYNVGADGSIVLSQDPGKAPTSEVRHLFKAEDADGENYEAYVSKDLKGSGIENIHQKLALRFSEKKVDFNSTEKKETSGDFNVGAEGNLALGMNTKLTLQLSANGKDILLLLGGAKLAKQGLKSLQKIKALKEIMGSIGDDLIELLKKQNLTYNLNLKMAGELIGEIGFSHKYKEDYEHTKKVSSAFSTGGEQVAERHNVQILQNRRVKENVFFEKEDQKDLSQETKNEINKMLDGYILKITHPESRTKIYVTGSASRTGTKDYNKGLSTQRAQKVRSYIMQKFGLDRDHFIMEESLGETKAVQEFTDPADRHVRIRIVEK